MSRVIRTERCVRETGTAVVMRSGARPGSAIESPAVSQGEGALGAAGDGGAGGAGSWFAEELASHMS